MSQVFVSYSRRDSEFVQDLVKSLRRRNYRVWMDKTDIKPGSNWKNAIESALDACAAVIAVLSPDSIESEWVGIEIDVALDAGKEVIPYLYRDCKPPLRLKSRQYIDHKDESAFEQLIAALPSSAHIHDSSIVDSGLIGRDDVTFEEAAKQAEDVLRPTVQLEDGSNISLIGLPLRPTCYCTSYLVGRTDDTLSWQPRAQLGMQFSQDYPGDHFPAGIARHFLQKDRKSKLRLLLIRGPLQITESRDAGKYGAGYGLDPGSPEEWTDAIVAAKGAIEVFAGKTEKPDLQIFMLGPVAMLYHLGVEHKGFPRAELYHYDRSRRQYFRVLGILD